MPRTTTAKTEDPKSRYSKRSTKDTTVHEILELFAPPREGATSSHLVSFGPQHYFLVIQGDQAEILTNRLLEHLDALQQHEDNG